MLGTNTTIDTATEIKTTNSTASRALNSRSSNVFFNLGSVRLLKSNDAKVTPNSTKGIEMSKVNMANDNT
jgi:hypothetical protein